MEHNNIIGCGLSIVQRLRANTSIMPPFIHHRYIATTINNLLHGWLILHGWTLFFIQRMKFGEKLLVNSCSWIVYLQWVFFFKSKFGICLCRRNEMKWNEMLSDLFVSLRISTMSYFLARHWYIATTNNNLLHRWLILHGWAFFSSNEWNLGKFELLVNSCSWIIYLQWVF